MKIKILAAGLILSFCFSNLALAGGLKANRATVLSQAPIYLLVEHGYFRLCIENIVPRAMDGYCLLKDQLASERHHSGSIEAVQGKLTVAKNLLIDADETLTNEMNDLGQPAEKIDFEFNTHFSKGMILKVWPDQDYSESGTVDTMGRLKFYVHTDGGPKLIMEIPYSDLVGQTNGKWESDGHVFGYKISRINFAPGADLAARNLAFKNKLAIASQLLPLEMRTRDSLLNGKITPALYRNFDSLFQSIWFKDYTSEDVDYFYWRFNRLKYYYQKYAPTPERYYGGLQVLMDRFN
jgi:hypothetical protein